MSAILSTTSGYMTASGTTLSVELPSGIEKGDGVLICVSAPNTISYPTGNQLWWNQEVGTNVSSLYNRMFFRDAQGWEGGQTLNLTLGASVRASYVAMRISKDYAFLAHRRQTGTSTSIPAGNARTGNRATDLEILTIVNTLNNIVPSNTASNNELLFNVTGSPAEGASVWIQKTTASLATHSSQTAGALTLPSSVGFISTVVSFFPHPTGSVLKFRQPSHVFNTFNATLTSNDNTRIGTSFLGTDIPINKIALSLGRGNTSSSGSVVLRIYEHTGQFSNNGTPSGSVIASSSNAISTSVLSSDNTHAFVEFDFNNLITSGGKPYFMVAEGEGMNTNGTFLGRSNNVRGNVAYYTGSSYTTTGTNLLHYVYVTQSLANDATFQLNYPTQFESGNGFLGANRIEGQPHYFFPYTSNWSFPISQPNIYWSASLSPDPATGSRNVFRFRHISAAGTNRPQINLDYKTWYNAPFYRSTHRMFFNSDMGYLNQYTGSIGVTPWLTLFEIWNGDGIATGDFPDGDVGGSCRWSFGWGKDGTADQPLFWRLNADYMQPNSSIFNDLWGGSALENRSVSVADLLNKWIKLDVYLKRGEGTAGRLLIKVTDESTSTEYTLFDVNNHTVYPGYPNLNLRYWQPYKIYTNTTITDFMATNSKAMEIFYDDLKIYEADNLSIPFNSTFRNGTFRNFRIIPT